MDFIPCIEKHLPADEQIAAAEEAIKINPANAPSPAAMAIATTAFLSGDAIPIQQRLAALTTKLWPAKGISATVGFMDQADASFRNRVLSHANAWGKTANIKFTYTADTQSATCRIGLDPRDGHWSYIGTDNLRIPKNQKTMNLAISGSSPESEFFRVVRHEFGHFNALVHEHLRRDIVEMLDVAKTLAWGRRALGWDDATIRSNILTPAEESTLTASTLSDVRSIMTYMLPAEITKTGQPIPGGTDINELDYQTIAKIYPKPADPPPPPSTAHKLHFALTGSVTAVKQVADETAAQLTLSLENDPGTVSVAFKGTTNGGTGMGWLTKILALWEAIKAGDWLKVIQIISELGKAQAAGQLTGAEAEAVSQALNIAMAQCPKS